MMALVHHRIKPIAAALAVTLVTLAPAAPLPAQQGAGARASTAPRATRPAHNYWVYVGAESADVIHRIRFGPAGIEVEKTIPVGESPVEMEGPHGLQISRDGKFLHMTTGHGSPDGKYWRYVLGPDTLAGPGTFLGYFPASIDVTPDGMYAFVVNFNLHGEMVPSSVSVIYTPTHEEVARTETCTMPHGSRVNPRGTKQYSTCMMDDQLVELDTRTFQVSRRFSLAKGKEGAVEVMASASTPTSSASARPTGDHADHDSGQTTSTAGARRHTMPPATCSPTWAQPSSDGARIYVACNKGDEIVEIDQSSWTITRRFATGRGPYNLATTPDGKLLVATLKQGGGVQIFNLATGRSALNVKSSTTVTHGIAITPDSRYAFVSNEGVGAAPGKVDVYDLRALSRVASVDVGQQAGGIAFWKMEPAR